MSRIIDLTDSDEDTEILTSTSTSGGLFGGGEILASDPLETYLYEHEQPKYALRNKKAGIEIEAQTGSEQITPGENYQAIALVTDVRILYVIGRESGDEMVDIPLTEVIEAKSESEGFRTSALVITTEADEIWQFACTGDVSEVASAVDEMAYIWANAQRLLDEAEDQLADAELELTDRNVEGARDTLGDSQEKIETAVKRIQEVGPAAQRHIESRARTLADWFLDVQRQLKADEAAEAHRQAQREWQTGAYEAAATEYEFVIDMYREALSIDGPTPTDGALEQRLSGALSERELLRVAPLIDADTARREAIEKEDPETAATAWEDALDGYRELLTLEWARDGCTFVANKEAIRDQTIEIADDAIEDHIRAGQQWIQSADQLAVDGHDEQAREVYTRARRQFELAEQLASEVRPERLDHIDNAIVLVDERISGDTPDEVSDDSPLETVEITEPSGDADQTTQQETQSEADAETPESVSTSTQQDVSADGTGERTPDQPGPTEAQTSGAIPSSDGGTGSAQPTDQTSPSSGYTAQTEDTASSRSSDDSAEQESASLIDQIQKQKQQNNTGQGNSSGGHSAQAPTNDEIQRALTELNTEEFDTLVAKLWQAQGWSTEVFSVAAKSAFDIIAFRDQPVEERLGIWTVHNTQEAVETAVVDDCIQSRDASHGADAATIVTTATVTTAGTARANEHDITIIDANELASLLQFEQLVERLFELADQ
jgi:tetratricopeptide (TPR) repeat protein